METTDEREIARLAQAERATLLAFARRRLGGRGDEAEDVVQESLLKAVRAVREQARPTNARAWLFTIVAHCCADVHASAARRPTEALPEGVELRDRAPGVARTVEARAEVAAAVRSIAALPEAQRHALVGYELAGDSYDELGARHGWSVGATKSLLWRARTRLAEERTGWAQIAGAPLVALRTLAGHAERPLAAVTGAPWGTGAAAAALGVAAVGVPSLARPAAPELVRPPRGPVVVVHASQHPLRVGGRTARVTLRRSGDPAAVDAACASGEPLAGRFTAPALLRARRGLSADAAEYTACATTIDRTLARGG
jgi:RNA polymerase sigma factor (sigma-70 family)